MSRAHVVIVGAGAAGTASAVELRRLGFEGDLTIVHGEEAGPYNRTAVNKALLHPNAELAAVASTIPTDPRTRLLAGTRATALDVDRGEVKLHDGRRLAYDALLIATGARPRGLRAVVSRDASTRVSERVTTLRTESDARQIRALLDQVAAQHDRVARVGVVGASLLGSESADTLRQLGHDVCLIDPAANPLARLLGSAVGGWVTDQHLQHLDAVFEGTVDAIDTRGHELALRLSTACEVAVDLVIAARGVDPDTSWLATTPLDLTDGVLVDDRLRTVGAEHVYAAGDLAHVAGQGRTEHWGYALAQGARAARSIGRQFGLHKDPEPARNTPSYATRLYGKSINVLGVPVTEHREVSVATQPEDGVHVSAFLAETGQLAAAVVLGSQKIANKLRPLVGTYAAIEEAANVVAAASRRPRLVRR